MVCLTFLTHFFLSAFIVSTVTPCLYLFGSFARGDYTDSSDIDIRVDKGELKGLFALSGLNIEISEALGMKVDLLTTGSLDKQFLDSIRPDEILLYENLKI